MAVWYGYYDPDRVLAAWPDAPVENEEILEFLLDVAKEQVLEFAPASEPVEQVRLLLESLGAGIGVTEQVATLLEGAFPSDTTLPGEDLYPSDVILSPPARYVYAQLQQAKNLFNAGRSQEDGSVGGEGYSFIPRPLDKTIQKLIRPTSGVADVF